MKIAAAILWSALVGYRVGRGLFAGLSREEKIAWGLAFGLLVQSALYGAFLLFGFEPKPVFMIAAGAVLALAPRRAKPPIALVRARPQTPPLVPVLIGFAALAWLIFLFESAVEPLWANDFLAIWGFKAKTIFLSSALPGRLFHDPAAAWSHPEYPLLVPLSLAAISAVAGSWNDHALALLFPAIAAAVLLALAGFFRRRSAPLAGAVAMFLAAVFFPLFQPFEAGMAEIPLALALLLAMLAAADVEESGKGLARFGAAVFLACGIKQEGALFAVIVALGFGARALATRRRRVFSVAATSILAAALHAAILRVGREPLVDRDYDLSYLDPEKVSALIARLGTVAGAVLRTYAPPLAVPALAVAVFLLLTPRRRLDVFLPLLALQVAAYAGVCSLSSFDPLWQLQFVPRIAGALFPMLAAILAGRLAAEGGDLL